ncbi:Dirigent protein [Thalictrum thalictroides]|uniref:Dirigent protein n=1 Tax=Thalictrum thalictroides TaxID=46969 RepID=A0A7J6VI54_THATH|nr:Dirigent protein [Thalictrum thalictroides]
MANVSRTSCYVLFLLVAVLLVFFTNTEALKPKVARLEFYMHDIVGGPNQTAVRVAPTEPVNFTSPDPIAAAFGSLSVMDNPLTATPDPKSALLGRAQGIYAMSSQHDEFSLLMTLTYVMLSGPYNGSTFSVVGRNPVMQSVREMPIVGGTGMFRLARGYCLAQTHTMSGMDAVIRYNVTVIHY